MKAGIFCAFHKGRGMFKKPLDRGFTLLEMCAVVVISGIALASFMQGYRVYLAGQRVRDVNNRLATIHPLLDAYASKHGGRYPCPSDPTLAPTDPNYGRES